MLLFHSTQSIEMWLVALYTIHRYWNYVSCWLNPAKNYDKLLQINAVMIQTILNFNIETCRIGLRNRYYYSILCNGWKNTIKFYNMHSTYTKILVKFSKVKCIKLRSEILRLFFGGNTYADLKISDADLKIKYKWSTNFWLK